MTLAQGTSVDVTEAAVRTLEASALEVKRELDAELGMSDGESVMRHVLVSVGEQPSLQSGPARRTGRGSHLGQVAIELMGSNDRPVSAASIVDRWRAATPPIPDVEELAFSSDYVDDGPPIDLELRSSDVAQLVDAAAQLRAALAGYPGVFDVTDSFREGKQELELSILPAAEALGLTLEDLARQVREAFYGEEAQRIQRGREDVKVMVRYPESQRTSLADLDGLRIRTPDGGEVPFRTVARAEHGHGFASIQRTDRQRVIEVSANVDETRANANQVLADIEERVLPGLLRDHPGLGYGLAGNQRDQSRGLAQLARSYLLALAAIYVLLAVPLRSYGQPLIIMAVIPFGLVGALGGHIVMGLGFSVMSLFGIVALSGVVVNSSLVLVHCVNDLRASGASLRDAVRAAGRARFRPIVLTTVTTFAGLTPLLLERRLGAQFLIPMATSLAFGVVFATVISLFLVPAAYCILDDLAGTLRAWILRTRHAAGSASGRS